MPTTTQAKAATITLIAMANHNSQLARESKRRWALSQSPTKVLPSTASYR